MVCTQMKRRMCLTGLQTELMHIWKKRKKMEDGVNYSACSRRAVRSWRMAVVAPTYLLGGDGVVYFVLCGDCILFVLAMGHLAVDQVALLGGNSSEMAQYADPVPQALVFTAIVISFPMLALFLVVMIVGLSLTVTDHVDGVEEDAQ